MEGMRDIAKSYYARASEEERKSMRESFRKLDVNGDGKISLEEFKKSVSSWLCAEAVFRKLDKNGDGNLDFDEFVCLHYMEKKVSIARCSVCWDLLVGPYFSCLLCLGNGSYDLCCSCYRHADLPPHHHSSDNMMDHHSLLTVFRTRTAAAQKSRSKKNMEEVWDIAKAHYRAGSPEVQALAYEFFQSMDSNGDGRVDLSEFLAFMRQEGYAYMENSYFFEELDLDSNGALDFSEVMTLYYIIKSGRPFCDCCGDFIPGIYFSCVECFKNNEQASFDLCRDCYRSAKYKHSHDGRSQFLDNYTLLRARTDPPANSYQAWNQVPTNARVPVQQDRMYIHYSYPTYNTYVVHPPNAIVPASSTNCNWNKWRLALHAFEVALSIGTATTLCTIL